MQVSQRQMAVELAPALLQSLEDPFAPVELPQPQAADGKTPAGANSKGNLLVDGQASFGAIYANFMLLSGTRANAKATHG